MRKIWHQGRLEKLLLCVLAVAVCAVVWSTFSDLAQRNSVHESAVLFAKILRRLEAQARNQNQFLEVSIVQTKELGQSAYLVKSGQAGLESQKFACGIFAQGDVTIDPQGVPMKATTFTFLNGKYKSGVAIDVKGMVSVF